MQNIFHHCSYFIIRYAFILYYEWLYRLKSYFLTGPEYVIHNLSFESTYSVRAAAYNAVGYSNYSEEVTKRTKGLVAETVVDGSSMSSSLNSALPSISEFYRLHLQVSLLVLCVIVSTFRWLINVMYLLCDVFTVGCDLLKQVIVMMENVNWGYQFFFSRICRCNSLLWLKQDKTHHKSTTWCNYQLSMYSEIKALCGLVVYAGYCVWISC